MKMKKLFKTPLFFLALFAITFGALFPTLVSADDNTTTAIEAPASKTASSAEQVSPPVTDKEGNIVPLAATNVAVLTMYSVPAGGTSSSGGSTGPNWGTHSFITVKNISSSNILVGGLSGIAPNRTISVGTWGNKNEHTGIWYNLEAKFIASGGYSGRVSHSMYLTQTQLDSVNSYIRNHDSWSYLNNCSSFAVGLWNSISSDKYTAGSPNTPQNLYNSIKDGAYDTNAAVPYDYLVYYANGSSAPIRSSEW